MSLYSRIADLPLVIEQLSLRGLDSGTSTGWTRHTTEVSLMGQGETGTGEDVTYFDEDQARFQAEGAGLPVAGTFTLDSFSRHLDGLDLFLGSEPGDAAYRYYRRWAFESAAADLALRQAGTSLGKMLDRPLGPLRFVASLGLGTSPTLEPLQGLRDRSPGLGFKIDFDVTWTEEIVAALAAFGGVETVDLKGQYRGVFEGPPADAPRYAMVARILDRAWIEDPDWNHTTSPVLTPIAHRITWDAPFHAVSDLDAFPNRPRAVSIKPSRFGTWKELLAVYERCARDDIAMYSGGQFELGVGRDQIQYLAAMFHADAPNDCAPREFNAEGSTALPQSPMTVTPASTGFALSPVSDALT
jgi:hypothetical protein